MKKLIFTLTFLFVVAILSLSAQTDVYPPTPLQPENGAESQMPDVVLDWSAVAGSGGTVMYELQLATDASFTNPQTFPPTDLSGMQMEFLKFGQEYFWRVRSMEGATTSDWSETFSFTVFVTVELDRPSDGDDERDPNVALQIEDEVDNIELTGVDHFEFEADTSANFDSPLLFHGSSNTFSLNTQFLFFGETYYWRARAIHEMDTSSWSEVWNFEVIIGPELDDPNSGSSDLGLENLLEWDDIPGVLNYTLQLADNDAFTNAMSTIVEGVEYTTDGFLTFGKEYFWRVRANHGADTSEWSETWNFTTASVVTLVSPEDGETDVPINPMLEWEEITGVDIYQLEYNDENNFEDPCCSEDINPEDNFYQVLLNLDKETTYYWRCRTAKGVDTTAWSEVWSFTTEGEIGIGETSFDASNISIYPNPNNGILNIDVSSSARAEISIYVMDMLGQVYVEDQMSTGQGQAVKALKLDGLANGLYIVKLTNGDQHYSQKITLHR